VLKSRVFKILNDENLTKSKTNLPNFHTWFKQVAKKIGRCFKTFIFIFSMLPNLDKSSCGSSPLWLEHKKRKTH